MNLIQDLYGRGALGPFIIGVISLASSGCFFYILLPVIAAQLRLRDNDRMARMRSVQIVVLGSLTSLLAWKGAVWLDASLLEGVSFSWMVARWPSDFIIGMLILIGGIYAVAALSAGRLRASVTITPLDHGRGGFQYRPEVDVALRDAHEITQRAQELDDEIRLLLTERARVLGETTPSPSSVRGG